MKNLKFDFKSFFKSSVICGILLFLHNCTSTPNLSNEECKQNDYQELISKLTAFSEEFVSNNSESSNSRDFLGFNKFIKSVKADFTSSSTADPTEPTARIAAVSASASRKKWKELNREEHLQGVEQMDEKVLFSLLNEYTQAYGENSDDIGALHNAIIIQMYLNHASFTTTQDLADEVLAAINDLRLRVTTDSCFRQEIVQNTDLFLDSLYADTDSVMFNRMIARYPALSDEISIVQLYQSNVVNFNTISTITSYTTGFSEIINESNLNNASKLKLNRTLSISPASYRLWMVIDTLSNPRNH